ncbi:MAG: hypothetical protein L0271_03465 [Gemmatimonadetes bacterium]|nr:hypothetical protein [Gemmatimonadota bacterium]
MRMRNLTIGLAALFAAACASGGTGGGAQTQQGADTGQQQGTTVQIFNTAPGAATVTVYMVPEIGVDTPLGAIDAGENRAFPFSGAPGWYRIRVVGPSGEIQSDRFQLFRNSSARWDMSTGRRVVVSGR